MITIILPDFNQDSELNYFLIAMARDNKDWFKFPVLLGVQHVNLPYLTWTGGFNTNYGEGVFYAQIQSLVLNQKLNFQLNFSNPLLEDYDFYDNMGQMLLKNFENTGVALEVSSITFMERIKEKYPYYDFVFSKNADLITPFTPELLNDINNMHIFRDIMIPDKYCKDLDWLSQINNKTNFQITINPYCQNCKDFDSCLYQESQKQLEYSTISVRRQCPNCLLNKNFISIEDIKTKYIPLGFQTFIFNPLFNIPANKKISLYADYLIKEEYRINFLETYNNFLLVL